MGTMEVFCERQTEEAQLAMTCACGVPLSAETAT